MPSNCSPNCVTCPNATKSIRHALWECPETHRKYGGGWLPIAIMPSARHDQVGKCVLVIMVGPN